MTKRSPLLPTTLLAMLGLALACSGATHGENDAGSSTWMEGSAPDGETGFEANDGFCQYNGAIATDDGAPYAYVMVTTHDVDCAEVGSGTPSEKYLIQASEDDGAAPVMSLTGFEDVRTLFPDSGMLVMAEFNGDDQLFLFDRDTREQLAHADTQAHYHGTRMSPSRDWVAAGDNHRPEVPIHLIDTRDLSITAVDVAGHAIEAMWLAQRDGLAAITESDGGGVRLVIWEVDGGAELGLDGSECDPAVDVSMPDHHFQIDWDYTWIGVHPEDELVVYPVEHGSRGDELLIVDALTGDVDVVANAHGPVGFTPGGETIVAYRYADLDGDGVSDEGGQPSLLLIDSETLETRELAIPFEGFPEYFVTREGAVVVVASMYGDQELVLYDLDSDTVTEVGGPSLGLDEFVSREGAGEIWMVDDYELYRLDFFAQEVQEIPLPFSPEHINILPDSDRLVLDEVNDTTLHFFDPESMEPTREVDLDLRDLPGLDRDLQRPALVSEPAEIEIGLYAPM